MRDPNKKFKRSKGQISRGTPDSLPDPLLDKIAYDELIKNRGLRWKHFKGTPCPNLGDLEIQSHDPNCNACENGMLFYEGGEVHGVFQANRLERMYEIQGVWDVGEAVITFSANMDDIDGNPGLGAPVDLQHFDKLMCLDYTFRWQELIEHSHVGIDRLRYPALTVEFVATVSGKVKNFYVGRDFQITSEGFIEWLPNGNKPTYDQLNSRGEVYTISYCARPVFYVVQLLHEIRATKAAKPGTRNEKIAVRLPQQVLIRRDYLFTHPSDTDGGNTTRAPRDGGNIVPS